MKDLVISISKIFDREGINFIVIGALARDIYFEEKNLKLDVRTKDDLINRIGEKFKCIKFAKETHVSPGGMEQKFNYWVFQKN